MLAQYCRHVVSARTVAGMIKALQEQLEQEPEEGTERLKLMLGAAKTMDRLLKMQEREGRALSLLATRMRLSQQSTYDRKKTKGTEGPRKPWEE